MFEGCEGSVCDAWSLQSSCCLLPSFVCCLSRLLNIELCRGLIFINKGAEVGGGGCFDDRNKASQYCVLEHCLDARLGCCEGAQVCWSRDVSRSCSPCLLQDRVAVHSQDVVDAAISQTSRRRANSVCGSWHS